MTKITKEEIYNIARMSCLEVNENEVAELQKQLQEVLMISAELRLRNSGETLYE